MKSQQTRNYLFILLGIIALVLIIYFLLPVSLPIVFAFVTALFLAPTVTFLMRKTKMNRALSVSVVFLLFLILLLFLSYFLLTKAVTQLNLFITHLPNTINELTITWNSFLTNLTLWLGEYSPDLVVEIDRAVINMLYNLRESLTNIDIVGYAANAVMKIPSYIISLLVYFIVLFLFLLDLPKLRKLIFHYFSDNSADKIKNLTSRLYNIVVRFFKAQLLVGSITFILILVAMNFIQPEVAIIMTLIIWMIDFIPIIGSLIILLPWATFHLIVGNFSLAIQLVILSALLLIIRQVLEPRVMGENITPSPLATIISLYLGWKLLGIIGLILGPLLLILYTSAKEAGFMDKDIKI